MKEVLKMREKRIVLVNDVTGLSRCSVACQLPIISAMGIETAFVPTAILSINTYHKDFFFDDYTSKMNDYIETYKKMNIDFDGICSGFLGSAKQIEIVKEFFKDFKTEKKSPAFYTAAKKIESILSFIAVYAKDHNYHKIIVAGGETSGAVTTGLGYSSFYIGQEICPGVPVLIPEENRYLQLILKSGNFGSEDFFLKAMEM